MVALTSKFTAIDAANFLGVSVQAIHKQLKTKNLAFEKTQNRVYFGHETAVSLFNLSFKKNILAFQIVKGGTGKTSLTHAIAVRSNLYGAKILCIDLDQQSNLTQAFQINAEERPVMVDVLKENINIKDTIINVSEGLDLIPSRIENAVLDNVIMLGRYPLDRVYRDKLNDLLQYYDLIIIDCPPALGQSVAAATLSSNVVIAPVTPEEFSLSGLKMSIQEILDIENNFATNIPFRIILNKFDTRTYLSHEILSTLIKHSNYSEKLFKTYIRTSQDFPNAIANGLSIFDNLKTSSAKEDIDLLTQEILGIQKKQPADVSLGNLDASETK